MTDRETLAARIEAAGVDEQRAMLGAAFNLLNPAPRSNFEDLNAHCAKGLRFKRMLDAEAYLDAAMMLVPDGWFTSDFHQGPSGGNWWELSRIGDGDQRYATVKGNAATPALALAAAAIRAGGV